MSEEIIKVLDNLGEKFGIAIDWTNQNVMPYLQNLMEKFITYRTATGISQIIIWTVLIIVLIIVICKLTKWSKSETYNKDILSEDDFFFSIGMVSSVMFIVISIIFIIGNIFGIMQNIFMPELTLIDYIQTLM